MVQQLFLSIVVVFHRIRSFFHNTQSLHHARFANVHELTGLLTHRLDGTSLLLLISEQ
jgi:hypothetical protein